MAAKGTTVAGPDGRAWVVTTGRQKKSFKESGKVPFLWLHLIVTTIVVVVSFFILKSGLFQIVSVMIVIAFVLWLVGVVNSLLRATISADTAGPPDCHRLWVVVKRRRRKPCIQEVEQALRTGQDALEPSGARLEEI